jgi:acetyl-CoA acetyltransferase
MQEDIYVLGVAMTEFGVYPDRSVADMTATAVCEALEDAGLTAGEIDSAFFGNTAQGALEGQLMVGGQIALRRAGLAGIPTVNLENACATGATAFNMAVTHVAAGASDVSVAIGVERMNIGDRARTMAIFEGASDVHHPEVVLRELAELGGGADTVAVGERSVFMDLYAAFARAHMKAYGSTQAQLAAIAAKNHAHAVHNQRAHYRRVMSVEQILAARPLAYPLTVPMCAPVTDGAAAAIVCRGDVARRGGRPRAVRVLGSVIGTGIDRDLVGYEQHVTQRTADRAYQQAGVGPGDVSVAEVHDATAFGELLVTELLGLAPPGEGGLLAERGGTSIGGTIPVNPSGGLESKGHPLGATGLGQIFEIVTQLRGEAGPRQVEGARIGLTENGGGYQHGEEAVAVVTLLGG